MTADLRFARRAQGRETLAESLAAATRSLGDHQDPLLVVYFPLARGNPYQQLLYHSAAAHGCVTVAALDLDEIEGMRWPVPAVVHLHWTRPITVRAESADDAEEAVDRAICVLEGLRSRGTPLMWTVHNVLPHECAYPEAEARLRQWLADHAAIVHVMGTSTADAVAEHYTLPTDDRVLNVPLPAYLGVDPDHLTRHEARFELGIEPESRLAVMVGALRGYKGIELLAQASDLLDDGWVVMVAGAPIDDEARREVEELVDRHPRLRARLSRVATEEMQLYMRAADLAALPYTAGLNSAALLTSMSFDLPAVVPAAGTMGEIVTDELGARFTLGDPASLAEAMLRVGERADSYRPAVREYVQQVRADRVSDAFFVGVRARLGRATPAD